MLRHQRRARSLIKMETNSSLSSKCVPTQRGHAVFTSWLIVYLLFFPIFIIVIHVGYKKRTKGCGCLKTHTCHSDVFTYHMVAMEMVNLVGSCLYFAGFMSQFVRVLDVGLSLKHLASIGEMSFHCLTCGERYLAVVHPITYLRLKKRGGILIRNVSICCAWIFSFGNLGLAIFATTTITNLLILGFAMAVLSLMVVSFCSVSVLCVLIRPGPGDGGGERKRIDQSKRAAVYTILAILGALLLRIIAVGFYCGMSLLSHIEVCVVVLCTYWFAMPSSLVLPLLFLHREGYIPGFRNYKNKS